MVKIEYIFKIYTLPFVMVVKILKWNNPKRSYVTLTIGSFGDIDKYEMEKSAFNFGVYHWFNWPRNHQTKPYKLEISALQLSQYI